MVHTYKYKTLHDMLTSSLRTIGDNINTFPFYNIKQGEHNAVLEIALAGYSKNDIKIELENNILIVSGNKEDKEDGVFKYTHHGIRNSSFSRSFSLNEHWEVDSVQMIDGILSINLHYNPPKEKQKKSFTIL